MATVELTDTEWGQLMSIVGDAPWKLANPLFMKIGQQLQAQLAPTSPTQPIRVGGNSQEDNHAER